MATMVKPWLTIVNSDHGRPWSEHGQKNMFRPWSEERVSTMFWQWWPFNVDVWNMVETLPWPCFNHGLNMVDHVSTMVQFGRAPLCYTKVSYIARTLPKILLAKRGKSASCSACPIAVFLFAKFTCDRTSGYVARWSVKSFIQSFAFSKPVPGHYQQHEMTVIFLRLMYRNMYINTWIMKLRFLSSLIVFMSSSLFLFYCHLIYQLEFTYNCL